MICTTVLLINECVLVGWPAAPDPGARIKTQAGQVEPGGGREMAGRDTPRSPASQRSAALRSALGLLGLLVAPGETAVPGLHTARYGKRERGSRAGETVSCVARMSLGVIIRRL